MPDTVSIMLECLRSFGTLDRAYRAALELLRDNGQLLFVSVRTRLGLSQREMARRLGVTHPNLSWIEGGRVKPSPDMLRRLLSCVDGEGGAAV